MKIKDKFFCGEIKIDLDRMREKDAIMEKVISQRIQENFMRVQNDVREIIRKECEVSQEITPHSSIKQIDLEKLDPFDEGG